MSDARALDLGNGSVLPQNRPKLGVPGNLCKKLMMIWRGIGDAAIE
jgi:hypothetical protein